MKKTSKTIPFWNTCIESDQCDDCKDSVYLGSFETKSESVDLYSIDNESSIEFCLRNGDNLQDNVRVDLEDLILYPDSEIKAKAWEYLGRFGGFKWVRYSGSKDIIVE